MQRTGADARAFDTVGILVSTSLSALLTEQVRRGEMQGEPGATALRHVAENPLRRLQKLLGHSHVATTYTYLDCLDEANELVDAALERWDADATWGDLVGAAP